MAGKDIKGFFKTFLLPLAALFFAACGLEDYPYINPIPQANITQQLNDRAVVTISNNNAGTAFSHLIIFYRIYVSKISVPSTTSSTFSQINPTLDQDYNVIRPYIDSNTLVNSNMDTLFGGRGYK